MVEIELNSEGVRALLRSDEVLSVLSKHATAIRSRCGAGYEQDSHVGKNRVNVQITATTRQSQRDNLKNNTLLKAVHK